MARRRLPYATKATLDQVVLLDGEIATDVSENRLRVGDGVTPGGVATARKDEVETAQADLTEVRDDLEFLSASVNSGMRGYPNIGALPVLTAEDVGERAQVEGVGNFRWDGDSWEPFDDPTVEAFKNYADPRINAERTLSNQRFAQAGATPLIGATGTNDIVADLPAQFVDVPNVPGAFFKFQATATNTGPMTLRGLPLVDQDGGVLPPGAVRSNRWYEVRYTAFGGGRYVMAGGDVTLRDLDDRAARSGFIWLGAIPGTNDLAGAVPTAFQGVQFLSGTRVSFQSQGTNTGPMTLMGLPFLDRRGNPIRAGTVRVGLVYEARYLDTNSQPRFIMVSGGIAQDTLNDVAAQGGVISLVTIAGGNDITAVIPDEFSGLTTREATQFMFRAPATNTGACTLMGLPLVDYTGLALLPGTIVSGKRYIVAYSTFGGGRYVLVTGGVDRRDVVELERREGAARQALKDLAELTGAYSPSLPLLDKVGAWYDFTDRRSLFTDATGTIPVREAGDPIGFIEDKSGGGAHFRAANEADRPTWLKNIGTVKAAGRFGAASYLVGDRKDISRNRSKITVFALVRYSATNMPNGAIISHSANQAAATARLLVGINGARPAVFVRTEDYSSAATVQAWMAPPGNHPSGEWVVIECQVDFVGGSIQLLANGWSSPEGYVALPGGSNSPDTAENGSFIGGTGSSSNPFTGDIAQIVEVVGEMEDEEREGLYRYFAKVADGLKLGDLAPYDPTGPLPAIFFFYQAPSIIPLPIAGDEDERFAVAGVASGGSVMVADYRFKGGVL